MKETITKIVEQGQELAEKRSWLKKGYGDLLVAINAELVNIPDMPEKDIGYLLKKWEDHSGENYGAPSTIYVSTRKITVDNDAYLVMRLGKQGYDGDWDWTDFDAPSVDRIRLFSEKVPEILDFFHAEIEKRNMKNNIAIDTIRALIEKLK